MNDGLHNDDCASAPNPTSTSGFRDVTVPHVVVQHDDGDEARIRAMYQRTPGGGCPVIGATEYKP